LTWNFNMSDAPEDKPVIAASICGVVTKSKWLGDRWNMFTKDVPPVAWQIWPDHPNPKMEKETKVKNENFDNMFD